MFSRYQKPGLLAIVIVALVTTGCTSAGDVERDDLTFDVVSDIAGVVPDANGSIALATGEGLAAGSTGNNTTLVLGLAELARTSGFQACDEDGCMDVQVPRGVMIAEAGLVSLQNLSLNADGPDGDSAVFFHDNGEQTGRFLRWSDRLNRFQMNADLQVAGNLTASDHVGTTTPIVFDVGQGPQVVTISTAATEGLETTIFARGAAQLDGGVANVTFPNGFIALVGPGQITAQLTPTSDGPPLYVAELAQDHMLVRATGGVPADTTFHWFVQAPRAQLQAPMPGGGPGPGPR